MKKIFLTLIAALLLFSCSQSNKIYSTQSVNNGGVVINEYRLENDIPVYIADKVSNDVCAVYVLFEGGTRLSTYEYSGLEDATLEYMLCGTDDITYSKLQSIMYQNQSSFSHYTMYCGSVCSLSCINYYLDDMLDIFLDSITSVSYDIANKDDYLGNILRDKEQKITRMQNDPQSILFHDIHKRVYDGTSYLASSSVQPESIENITIENFEKMHEELLNSKRIKVVAVGKINKKKFLKKLNGTLGKLAGEEIPPVNKNEKLNLSDEKITLTHKAARGSEIAVRVFEAPKVTSPDYITARLTEDIFTTTMFNIIREKYGACYSPGTQIDSSDLAVGFDYGLRVSDMKNFSKYLAECQTLMLEGRVISSVDGGQTTYDTIENVLEGTKNAYITKKYMSQASTSGIASRLAASLLQFGDLTSADAMMQKVESVSADDIEACFKKYWVDGKSQWFEMRGE